MASSLKGTPLRYKAVSASDSIDATDTFPGAMAELKNLIPMPQCNGYWMCRPAGTERSEEHTSELQSRENLVCRLLLEKKKDSGRLRSVNAEVVEQRAAVDEM